MPVPLTSYRQSGTFSLHSYNMFFLKFKNPIRSWILKINDKTESIRE